MKKYASYLLLICLTFTLFISVNILGSYGISEEIINPSNHNLITSNDFLLSQEQIETPGEEPEKQVPAEGEKLTAYPVTFDHQTLFTISNAIANISPESRAKRTSELIKQFAKDYSFEPDSIEIIELSSQLFLLSAQNIPIATITDADAQSLGLNLPELADRYKQIIVNAVQQYRQERSVKRIIINIGMTIGITILFLVSIKLVLLSNSWLIKKIKASEKSFFKNVKIQQQVLISTQQQEKILLTCLNLTIWLINFFLFFTYVGFVFRIFPNTQKYGDIVFSSFKSAITSTSSALTSYLPNLFIIAITLFLVQYIIRFSNFLFHALREGNISIPGFYQEWAEPTGRIVDLLIYAIALAIIFPYLPGANSPAFRGVSFFLGALVTFGGASAISNVIGGIIVIYTRAYQIGDLVKVGDIIGNVLEKTILSTRIRTPNNQIVTIPNSTIVSSNIVNYTATNRELKEPLILNTTITLGYDIPWRKVHQVLIEAALATTNISHDFKPFVLQTGLNDFYVSYELKVYTKLGLAPSLVPRLNSELYQNIQDKCNEADIEILSPHYSAIRDGNHNTIPAHYLPDSYQAPGFKIDNYS